MRTLRIVLAAAVVVAGLSGCDSKVGVAAVVGGERIADSDLTAYVTRSGPSAATVKNATSPIQPRVQVLSTLIQEKVVENALSNSGGIPADAALEALHDEATQRFLGNQSASADYDAQLTARLPALGFSTDFLALLLRVAELEDAMVQRTKAASFAALVAQLNKYPIAISVSGRWGTWDKVNLALSTAGNAGLPDFVTFGSGATADATQ